MSLTNIFADPEKVQRLIDIAQSSLWPLLEGALFYTLPLTFISFFFGIILAVLTALARISTSKPLQILARIYVSAIRGTPLLVQLFILFFGLPTVGIVIDPFPAAVFGFSLNVGAYASEVIRASILSIPKGQWEAAHTIGMNYYPNVKANHFAASNESIYSAFIEYIYQSCERYIVGIAHFSDRNV